MVSPNRFHGVSYYVDPECHIQLFQFITQEYIFSIYFNFSLLQYVVMRFEKEVELEDFRFFDYETHKHLTIRQFVANILDFGNSQIVIRKEEEYKLESQLSHCEPIQFTVLA